MHRLLRVITLCILWFGLWLLLVEKFQAAELIIGAVCALVAGLLSELAWGAHLTAFVANPRLLLQAWRLPKVIGVGTVEILRVLMRHLFTRRRAGSHLLVVPFEAGSDEDPQAATRRALAITYTTTTPNFVVIGIDETKQSMLYHQLQRSDVPVMTQKLGARP